MHRWWKCISIEYAPYHVINWLKYGLHSLTMESIAHGRGLKANIALGFASCYVSLSTTPLFLSPLKPSFSSDEKPYKYVGSKWRLQISLGIEVQLYGWWHANVWKVVVVNTINVHSGNLLAQSTYLRLYIHNHMGLHSIITKVGEIYRKQLKFHQRLNRCSQC